MEAGKRFIFGLPGNKITPFIAQCIVRKNLLGVVLFNRNFENKDDLKRLCFQLRTLKNNILICIDQEGGDKSRLTTGFPNHPCNQDLARRYDPEVVMGAYETAAIALGSLGINMNLAPVVDLGIKDSYIEKRCFSKDPDIVSKFAISAISGIRAAGLLACAKHFVGLGGSKIDPHKKLPWFLDRKIEEHLKPFFRLAVAGVDAIMTTHIIVQELSDLPVTISREAINVLRKDILNNGRYHIGYDGPIFTDDLLMGGSTELDNPDDMALRAMLAGHDVCLICNEEDWQKRAIGKTEMAIIKSPVFAKMHEVSLRRINKLVKRC